MSLFVKAYLPSAEGNYPEIRRFQISLDGPSTYQELEEKVAGFFPSLKNEDFKIYWKDDEGEKIVISSDVELVVAINHLGQGDLFKIYLQTASKANGEEIKEHAGVICDGCDGKVMGSRFKCCICPDYDLCGACESRGLHQEHHMYRFRQPLQRPVDPWRTFMQHYHRGFRPYCKRSGIGAGKSGAGKCGPRGDSGGDKDTDKKPSTSQQQETRKFLKEVEGGLRGFLNTMGIDFTLDVAMDDDTGKPTDASGKSPAGGDSEKPSCSGAGAFPWQEFCGGVFPFGSCPSGAMAGRQQQGAEATNGAAGNTAEDQHMADGFEDPMKDIMQMTLEQLKGMGFTDEDEWLTTLVRAKNGDLNKVLDALRMPPDAQA